MTSLGSIAGAVSKALGGQDPAARHGQPEQQNVRVIAHFYSDEGFDGQVDWSLRGKGDPDPPFHIVGLTTQKRFGGAPGIFQLSVKAHQNRDLMTLWEDPEDVWVRIAVVKNGVPVETMLGLISTISETVARTGNGQRVAQYVIEGLDFQKVLTSMQLLFNLYDMNKTPVTLMFDALNNQPQGSPGQTVERLLRGWLGNQGLSNKAWMLPRSLGGGGAFFDLLKISVHETRGLIQDPAIYDPSTFYGSTLWGVLEEYSNGLLNEMYCTLNPPSNPKKPPQPEFVLRERPFPSKAIGDKAYNALRTHSLALNDVQQRQVSKGAPESRFNYWIINPQGNLGAQPGVFAGMAAASNRTGGVPGSFPIHSNSSVQAHGLRQFAQATRYLSIEADTSWYASAAKWLQLLHDWYAVSPYELAGTIMTTTLFPQIQIGERVVEQRRTGPPVTYYVEGVGHSWQYPGPGFTTLNLTRGQYEDKPLLDIVYRHVSRDALDSLNLQVQNIQDALVDLVFPREVPHGSGVRMDQIVGQIEPPERVYLRQQGILPRSDEAQQRGELENPDTDTPTPLSSSDLPDTVVADADLPAAVAAPKPTRKAHGNLSQRELEQGALFPVEEENQNDPPPSTTNNEDFLIRRPGRTTT